MKKNRWIILIVVIVIIILLLASLLFSKSLVLVKNFMRLYLVDLKKEQTLMKNDLENIPDDELVMAVMEWMWEKVDHDWESEYEIISTLPKACQNIYSVYQIEAEVNNGGFNQCFYNSSKEFTVMAESGFEAIGAKGFADIMKRANNLYSEIKDDLDKYQDGTIEGFSKSYENNPLNELEEEFYQMYEQEQLDKLCVEYIKQNMEYFGN